MTGMQITTAKTRNLKKASRLLAWIIPLVIVAGACSHFLAGSDLREANELFNQGKFAASIEKYEKLVNSTRAWPTGFCLKWGLSMRTRK